MKGVKYNLKFKKGKDYDIIKNLNMKELINKIKEYFNMTYGITIKVNNQIIYNLIKRPYTVNKLLRNFCHVEKYKKNP